MIIVVIDNYLSASLISAYLERLSGAVEGEGLALAVAEGVPRPIVDLVLTTVNAIDSPSVYFSLNVKEFTSVALGMKVSTRDFFKTRQNRRADLLKLRRTLEAHNVNLSEVNEVWFGNTPLLPLFQALVPNARFRKFEHGISDTLASLVPDDTRLLRRLTRAPEALLLGFSTFTRPTQIQVSLVPERGRCQLAPEDIRQVHGWVAARYLASGEIQTRKRVSPGEFEVLVLPPLLLKPSAEKYATRFATRLWGILQEHGDERLVSLALKPHPDQIGGLKPQSDSLLVQAIRDLAPNEWNGSVHVVNSSVPAEVLISALEIDLLVGVLSTSLLNTRALFPRIPVVELDWSNEYQESCMSAINYTLGQQSPPDVSASTTYSASDIEYIKLIAKGSERIGEYMEQLFANYPNLSWHRT